MASNCIANFFKHLFPEVQIIESQNLWHLSAAHISSLLDLFFHRSRGDARSAEAAASNFWQINGEHFCFNIIFQWRNPNVFFLKLMLQFSLFFFLSRPSISIIVGHLPRHEDRLRDRSCASQQDLNGKSMDLFQESSFFCFCGVRNPVLIIFH